MKGKLGLTVAIAGLALAQLIMGAGGNSPGEGAWASSVALAETYYHTLSPAAFAPTSQATAFEIYTSGVSGGGGSGAIYAPVELPDGATIKGVRFIVRDAEDDVDVRMRLDRYPVASNSVSYMAMYRSAGVSQEFQEYEAPLNWLVANQAEYYYVVAYPTGGDWVTSNTTVKSVIITYTLPASMRAYMPYVERGGS